MLGVHPFYCNVAFEDIHTIRTQTKTVNGMRKASDKKKLVLDLKSSNQLDSFDNIN